MEPAYAFFTAWTFAFGHNTLFVWNAKYEHVGETSPDGAQNKKEGCVNKLQILNQAKSLFLKTRVAASRKKKVQVREIAPDFNT